MSNGYKSSFVRILGILVVLIIIVGLFVFGKSETIAFETDPVVTYGHEKFFWEDGIVQPDENYVLAVQNHYIVKYQNLLGSNLAEGHRIQNAVNELVSDQVVSNGLYLDWLLKNSEANEPSGDFYTLAAVRYFYLTEFGIDQTLAADDPYRMYGIVAEIAESLPFAPIDGVVQAKALGGSKYIESCRDEGVPVPAQLFDETDPKWTNAGYILEALSGSSPTTDPETGIELWAYTDMNEPGVCLAVKRKFNESAGHFDLICLGMESSKACFFESKGFSNETNLDSAVDLSTLDAGQDTNVAAPCTRCHVGENPFIVHPSDPAFSAALETKAGIGGMISWNASDVFEAIHVDWPPNPPLLDLEEIYSEQRCSDCHVSDYAGYFPDIAGTPDPTAYSSYCSLVVKGVLEGASNFSKTMPLLNPDAPGFELHKDYLLAMCDQGDEGELVDNNFNDDNSVLSPPNIVTPLFQCAKSVYVDNYVDGADVEVRINDVVVDTLNSISGTEPVEFLGIGELQDGDVVQARQRIDGSWSELTRAITTDEFTEMFPDGLPAPTIDPSTVYQCASQVAVRYAIPGFDVEVRVNGDDPVSTTSFAGHKSVTPGKTPFELGDRFTAQVFACSDTSPISNGILAQRPSIETLTIPTIKTNSLYESHRFITVTGLTYGSNSEVLTSGGGSVGAFSTPISWKNFKLNGPMTAGEQLVIGQELCEFSSQPSFAQAPSVLSCSALPAPAIKDPLPGQDFVEVIEPILGARVRVYDADANEIGDGTGGVIILTRPLKKDEFINVTQQTGDCSSAQAFMIQA